LQVVECALLSATTNGNAVVDHKIVDDGAVFSVDKYARRHYRSTITASRQLLKMQELTPPP